MRALILFLLIVFALPSLARASEGAIKETAYERIMRTNTIRCGYYVWPPFMMKDPNTGALSGFGLDFFNEVGKQLSLKIDWVAEVSYDTMLEGVQTGRYDMICLPLASTPARARASDFTLPIAFIPYYLYAKEGDHRFDHNPLAANDPAIKYASLDGDMNAILGAQIFPKAEKFGLPPNALNIDTMMALSTGKADVTTMDPTTAQGFMKANPSKVRQVDGPPVRVLPFNYPVPIGDERLKAMLNITFQSLLDTGFVEQLFAQYPDYGDFMLHPSKPYELVK